MMFPVFQSIRLIRILSELSVPVNTGTGTGTDNHLTLCATNYNVNDMA